MRTLIIAGWLLVVALSSRLQAAPFLEGRVTDEFARPIAGASVAIADCIGTCFAGKTVLTDEAGHYVFEEKPFRNYPALSASMPGRYEVAREETGPNLFDEDSDSPRRVDFVLGTPAEAEVRLKGDVPQGWTQNVVFRPGRDVKLHHYDFATRHVSGWDYRDCGGLPRNELLHLVIIRQPAVEPSEDSQETKERQAHSREKRIEIISPPIRLTAPQRYRLRANVEHDPASDTYFVAWDSIIDAVGLNRTQELVVPDPSFGPPASAAAQELAQALLKRIAAAATPWNGRLPRSIESFEYDVIDRAGKTTHVRIDQTSPAGPAWSDIARQRGLAYMPPLRWLFSQPENVVFHGVDIGNEQAVLHYRLKSGRSFTAGAGVGHGWSGFFTAPFSAGKLVVDVKSATVLEHRLWRKLAGEESVETFSDYVAVDQGYAPRSLRVQSGNFDFRFAFQVHNDTLWLLDTASHGDEKPPVFRIEKLSVNVMEQ
jgi:hypothetical protein